MSVASFIHVSEPPRRRPSPGLLPEDVDEHAALIGLQALTLNLASANLASEEGVVPQQRRGRETVPQAAVKRILKPLSISTSRKTPEKHVSISPQSVTPRSLGSSPRSRPSPSRSESSGFHSLASPHSSASDSSAGSGSGGHSTYCWYRGRYPSDARLFTNHANVEVKPSGSMESVNTRGSGGGGSSRQRQTPSRSSRQGTPSSRQSTPQPRQSTPQPRQSTPQSRQNTPQSRQNTPQSRQNTPQQQNSQRTFEEHMSVFDVQQGLKKGQLVEGILRINPKSYKDAYISAPDGRTDIYIGGVRDRNRALHGDLVALQLRPQHEWKVLDSALVTYLISGGGQHDLDVLYESDAHLQKNAAFLDQVLPQRFPRPLRLGCPPANQDDHSASVGDGASTMEAGANELANNAVMSSAAEAGANQEATSPVTSSTVEEVGVHLQAALKSGEGAPDGDVSDASDDVVVEAITVDGPETADQEGPPEDDAAGESKEPESGTSSQKTRRGTRAGRRKRDKGSGAAESVADRLIRSAATQAASATLTSSSVTSQMAGLSMAAEGSAGVAAEREAEVGDERRDTETTSRDGVNVDTSSAKRAVLSASASVSVSTCSVRESGASDQSSGHVPTAGRSPASDRLVGSSASFLTSRRLDGAAQTIDGTPVKLDSIHETGAPGSTGKDGCEKGWTQTSARKRHADRREEQEEAGALGVSVGRALKHPQWARFVQRTAKVVHILELKHPRSAVGELRMFPDGSIRHALFAPRDHRIPRMKVQAADCPPDFFSQPGLFKKTLFMAKIAEWSDTNYARGVLSGALGETGTIDVEMTAILLEHGVDVREFGPQDLQGLPESPFVISEEEITERRDLRRECVFTIDPLTARDLDDAVSCRALGDGMYQVGVHIADVSHFLKPGVPADLTAAFRCNTVYLVHKVIPMLPRVLCEDLCSLNPAVDRLTFSVIWTLDEEGQVFDEWFGRTVIRSCTKMAYEHAQRIIDEQEGEFDQQELPPIDGAWTQADIRQRVLALYRMSVCMRRRRTEAGALRLDQPKLCFTLDGPNGDPTGFYTYNQQASNRLIEEFMLLANMAVANRLLRSFPSLSVLRRHTEPQEGPLADAARLLRGVGLQMDVDSSGGIRDSLQAMEARWREELGDDAAVARMAVVVNILSKPMNPAEYFCSGVLTDASEYGHYALSVPLYTHFTSPIRRYPDVMVHRLLAAALKLEKLQQMPPVMIQRLCVRCNERKLAARLCSESSALLFLAHFVDIAGPLHQPAVVMAVLDKAFDVFLTEMAVTRRVYIDRLDVSSVEFTQTGGVPRLDLYWRATETEPMCRQRIELFSSVQVTLHRTDEPLKFTTMAYRPVKEGERQG